MKGHSVHFRNVLSSFVLN